MNLVGLSPAVGALAEGPDLPVDPMLTGGAQKRERSSDGDEQVLPDPRKGPVLPKPFQSKCSTDTLCSSERTEADLARLRRRESGCGESEEVRGR